MIDLKTIIQENPKILDNQSLLNQILYEKYPDEKRDIFILLAFMECGIVKELQNLKNKKYNDLIQSNYIMRMYDEYGFDEKYSKPLLKLWTNSLGISLQQNINKNNIQSSPQNDMKMKFYPNKKVYHKSWGEGTVIESRLEEGDEVVIIDFKNVGQKKLIVKIPNLYKSVDKTTNSKPSSEIISKCQYHPLERVYQKSWGEGIVLESKFENGDEVVTVEFKSVGLKKLVAKYAKLKKI